MTKEYRRNIKKGKKIFNDDKEGIKKVAGLFGPAIPPLKPTYDEKIYLNYLKKLVSKILAIDYYKSN